MIRYNHGQDAHATKDAGGTGVCGTGVPPVVPLHGQDAHATQKHGQDAHATQKHGQNAHATQKHGQNAHATQKHEQNAHATQKHEQDVPGALRIRQGAYLPHWTMESTIYTVTFRLSDSLPPQVLEAWLLERDSIVRSVKQKSRGLTVDEEKRLRELCSEKMEKYLNAGHGASWMKQERIAEMVAGGLTHFDGDRYDLLAWCVMPNHVHVVMQIRTGCDLAGILHTWKSFTAKKVNKALGRQGQFWQEEYYDHLVRDEKDLRHCVEYVLGNPELAGLNKWKWVGGTSVRGTDVCGTGVSPVMPLHGQDAHATQKHGQDAHATQKHGQDAHATKEKSNQMR